MKAAKIKNASMTNTIPIKSPYASFAQKRAFTITNDISLRRTCKADFWRVARFMRVKDRAEIQASHGKSGAGLLRCFCRQSLCSFTLCAKGRAVGLTGIVPDSLLGRRACVWLVTARGVEHFPLGFVKAARRVVKFFSGFYPLLYNYVDLSYPQAVRFVKLVGGKAQGEKQKAGQREFQLFLFRRNQLWEEQ